MIKHLPTTTPRALTGVALAVALVCATGILADTSAGATAVRIGPDGGPTSWIVARPKLVLTGIGPILGGSGGNVWASNDLGVSWHLATTDQARSARAALAAPAVRDPRTPSLRYRIKRLRGLGTRLQVSGDGGRTFTTRGELGGAPMERDLILSALATTPQTTLLATARQYESGRRGGIWRSTDGGRRWVRLPILTSPSEVTRVPGHPTRAYVGDESTQRLYRTDDAGATWRTIGAGMPPSYDIGSNLAIVSGQPNRLLNLIDNTVYRSRDAGTSWSRIGRVNAWDLTTVPRRPSTLFAAGDRGVFRSRDQGRTWVPVNRGRKASGLELVVGGGHLFTLPTDSVPETLTSDAQGLSWSRFHVPHSVDWSDSQLMLAVDGTDAKRITAVSGGIRLTSDGGVTWTETGMSADILAHDSASNGIYATTWAGRTLYSPRAGEPFTVRGTLPERAHDLVAASGVLYALDESGKGMFRSFDGGATWRTGTLPTPTRPSESFDWMTAAPTRPRDVYVGGQFGIQRPSRSTDGGTTWTTLIGSGLPKRDYVFTLIVDRTDPDRLFAGLFTGVWTSGDRGATWTKLVGGPRFVLGLTQDPTTPSRLYATTMGFGMWRIDR